MLKLNTEKTELLVIGAKNKITPPIEDIHVAGKNIEVSSNAKKIGITFDTHMNLDKHVMSNCKTACYYLCNIERIGTIFLRMRQKYLSTRLFHPSWTSVMLLFMDYHNRNWIGFSTNKIAQQDWCKKLQDQNK